MAVTYYHGATSVYSLDTIIFSNNWDFDVYVGSMCVACFLTTYGGLIRPLTLCKLVIELKM